MKKKTKKTAKKPAASRKHPMMRCSTCGMNYEVGAPHSEFCRGTKETVCEQCGKSDPACFKCRSCEQVVCTDCGIDVENECHGCFNGEGEEEDTDA